MSVYFVSDLHFGVPSKKDSKIRENLFLEWLDFINKEGVNQLYIMGDLFDFWYEYKQSIPKGYVRIFGKLAQMIDSGIKITFFKGNHDMWDFGYFQQEIGMTVYDKPVIQTIENKKFYLAHGDGLGRGDIGYKFIKVVFRAKFNRWLFGLLHPDIGLKTGWYFSRKSRKANDKNPKLRDKLNSETEMDKILNQPLPVYSRELLKTYPDIDYFIYGHWHKPQLFKLTDQTIYANVGDWITNFSYLKFDGITLELKYFHNDK